MTNAIRETFGKDHVVLPVIHVVDYEQARRNAIIAKDMGADGVFIISHTGQNSNLLAIGEALKEREDLPYNFFLGVNLLGYDTDRAYKAARESGFNGLWVDDPIDISRKGQNLLYFGGVAFKTQAFVPDEDLAETVLKAVPYMDVICASGPKTGSPAETHRLKIMADALDGKAPLAVASGVTPENVRAQMDAGVQAFLVSTGVSLNFHEFDPARVEALVREVHRVPRVTRSTCGHCGHPWWRRAWDRKTNQHSETLGECKYCERTFLLSELPSDDEDFE